MKSSSCGFGVSSIYQQAWKPYKPYLFVCVSKKQIILPPEDTAIFIRQLKWTWCLLFFRHLHSCSMEFCRDLGGYCDLGLSPLHSCHPLLMDPLPTVLAYLLLTCHSTISIFWLVSVTLDCTFGHLFLWQKTAHLFSAISQQLLSDVWLPRASFQEVNMLVGSI